MKSLIRILCLTTLLFVLFLSHAGAHRLQPAYLEINEQTLGTFNILWKRPLVGNKPMNIYPQLPAGCSNLTEPVLRPSQSGGVERWLVDCGESGMTNETIVIDGLASTANDPLLRM